MNSVTLYSTADTWINQDNATANYGTATSIWLGESASAASLGRLLVKFDLSALSGATILTATLTLTYNGGDDSSNARTVACYRVLRAWVEAQATWNVYSTGNSWATAGCGNTTTDRDSTDIGDGPTQSATPAENGEVVFVLTAARVQEMIDGTMTNNGFLFQVATENADQVDYKTREHADGATKAPKLVITYTPRRSFRNLLGVGR